MLEYTNTIWTMELYHIKHQHQETANHSKHSCIATGCTQDTNTQQHKETSVLWECRHPSQTLSYST